MPLPGILSHIGNKSGEELTMNDMGMIRGVLESMEAPMRFDMERAPRTGERIYSFVDMMMIMLFTEVRKTTFGGAVADLNDIGGQERLKALGMPFKNGRYRCPSKSTISDFVNKVWPRLEERMSEEIRTEIIRMVSPDGILITVDSTPLEASRYSKRCEYSPHYEIRMDKSHILMTNGIPLVQTWTGGNGSDYKELFKLTDMMGGLNPSHVRGFVTDGSYHGFEAYAEVFKKTGKVLATNQGKDAVHHPEAEWKDIERAYAKMWRLPEFRPSKYVSNAEKIRFLIKHGKANLVGRFMHNLDLARGSVISEQWALERHVCETRHFQFKRWMRYDVRGLRAGSVRNRLSLRFLFAQILTMAMTPN